MTVTTGPMLLNKAEPTDVIEDFENGLAADGGEWTELGPAERRTTTPAGCWARRSRSPPAMIPDGSITAAKLDASVLLPYALTDGSRAVHRAR